MKVRNNLVGIFCIFLLNYIFLSASHASLLEYQGGLVYDTDFNITWLKDSNYAKTSGYDSDGMMTKSVAMTWVA